MNSSMERNQQPKVSEFQENLQILQECPFFARFPLEALKVFAYLCTREVFEPGDMLFSQNDNDGQAFYVLTGRAQLIREEEGEEIELSHIGEGDYLGCLNLLGDVYRLFSLKALERTTCLVLAREKFGKALAQFPNLTPKILESVIEAVQGWEEKFIKKYIRDCVVCRESVGVTLV